MPILGGLETCKALKENPKTEQIPIIFLTAKSADEDILAGFEAGAVDYITKPFKSAELKLRVKNQMKLQMNKIEIEHYNRRLEDEIERHKETAEALREANQEVWDTQREVIFTLDRVVGMRSKETAAHIQRVSSFSSLLALRSGFAKQKADILYIAASMHDIGKVGISDDILHKPGKLTDDERKIMEKHAEYGYQILCNSNRELLQTAAVVARSHHENWDGSGYPLGLQGEEIPIYGRIVAVADVFDALMNKRCYKEAWDLEEVIGFFKKESGRKFDPSLVNILFENLQGFMRILQMYPDDEKSKEEEVLADQS